jgi:hypothetical protein
MKHKCYFDSLIYTQLDYPHSDEFIFYKINMVFSAGYYCYCTKCHKEFHDSDSQVWTMVMVPEAEYVIGSVMDA